MPDILLGEIFNIDPAYFWVIVKFAAMLAALGMIDSLLTSVIADNITKTQHNSNRELIGQGIGNMIAAAIGGLPGAGATVRTVVNINSSGKTRVSDMVHGLFLLIVGAYTVYIPLAVLAGILITVGIGIIDYRGLRHLRHVPRSVAVVLLIVLAITVFGNLINAVGVGVVLACVLFMKKASDLTDASSTITAMAGMKIEERRSDEEDLYRDHYNDIYIQHLEGPLFFGFISRFQEKIKSLNKVVKILIFRMDKVPHIDQSGLYALEEAILDLERRGILVAITGLQSQPRDMLEKIDIIPGLISDSLIFDRFGDWGKWIITYLKSNADLGTPTDEQKPETEVDTV